MEESKRQIDDVTVEIGHANFASVYLPKGIAVATKKTNVLPYEKRTVSSPSGRMDIFVLDREVAEIVGCKAGVVRLLNGIEGRTGGFGNAHIESHAERMRQFETMGHRSVFHYCVFVGDGVEAIAVQHDGRIMLIRRDASNSHQIICQWDEELGIWSVTTAIPMRRERGLNIRWGRAWN